MAFIAAQSAPSTLAPGDGSRTLTATGAPPILRDVELSNPEGSMGVLRLRGGPRNRQRVAWDEEVVDNEGCGKKSSKVCCIYHKPRKFDESSSEESSDSDSEHGHHHPHRHRHDHEHRPGPSGDGGADSQMRPDQRTPHQLHSEPDRNTYETMPKSNKGKRKACRFQQSMELKESY